MDQNQNSFTHANVLKKVVMKNHVVMEMQLEYVEQQLLVCVYCHYLNLSQINVLEINVVMNKFVMIL